VRVLPIEVQQMDGGKTFSLEADKGASDIVRGVVLSKRLSKLAQKARLKRIKLSAADKEEVNRLVAIKSSLKGQLDVQVAYGIRPGMWLEEISLDEKQPETLVALINPKSRHGHGWIVQKAADGTILGGVTVKAL